MQYIVFDLELNQDIPLSKNRSRSKGKYPFEIIQIGAIKLDSNLNTIDTFNSYVKPDIYTRVSPFITKLTKITTRQLNREKLFPDVYKDFIKFIGNKKYIFCTWGMSDIVELFKSTHYYKLDTKSLSKLYINIQPYVSTYFGLSSKKLLSLQSAVESLGISIPYGFHNALYDAYYAAEIFKRYIVPLLRQRNMILLYKAKTYKRRKNRL